MSGNVVVQGKLDTDRTKVQEIYVDAQGRLYTVPVTGSLSQFSRLAVAQATNYTVCTADTLVKSGATLACKVLVVVAPSAAIDIRDSTSAGTGTVVFSIPASAAVGTIYDLGAVTLNSGLFADFAGTGTISVLYV